MTALGTIVAASPLNADDGTRYTGFTIDLGASQTATFALGDMPADFQDMNTLSWTYDGRESVSGGDDDLTVSVRIVNGATILAAADAGGTFATIYTKTGGGFSTTDVTRGPTAFGYVNGTANAATWNGATVEIRQTHVKQMGPDGVRPEPDYFAITGDYTVLPATQEFNRSDSGALTEGAPTASADASLTDSGALTEVASVDRQTAVAATDSGAFTDNAALGPVDVAATDTGALTETPSIDAPDFTGTDSGTLSDVSGARDEARIVSDSFEFYDALPPTDIEHTPTDSFALADTAAGSADATGVDSAALTDTATVDASADQVATDAGALTEAAQVDRASDLTDAGTLTAETFDLAAASDLTDAGAMDEGGTPEYRVNVGPGADPVGWEDDTPYVAGSSNTFSTTDPIDLTDPSVPPDATQLLFQGERWWSGTLQFEFSVANGDYEVRLYFAEIFHEADGLRTFHVDIEGVRVLTAYDIHAEVGHDKGVVKTFQTTVTDGTLDVDFASVVDNAKVNAIEILSTSETVLDQSSDLTDSGGLSAETPAVDVQADGTDAGALTSARTLDAGGDKQSGDTGTLSEAVSISAPDISATDSGALTEVVELEKSYTVTDDGTLTDASSLTQTGDEQKVGTDSGALSESASITIDASTSDSGTLTDTAALGESRAVTDSASVTESAVLSVSVAGVETGTLTSTASFDAAVTVVGSFSFTEQTNISLPKVGTDAAALSEVANLVALAPLPDDSGSTADRGVRGTTTDRGARAGTTDRGLRGSTVSRGQAGYTDGE